MKNEMENRLTEREMTSEERKMIEEALEKWWREFEQKLIEHIPDNEKHLYIREECFFELESSKVTVDEDGVIYFDFQELDEENIYHGCIYNGKIGQWPALDVLPEKRAEKLKEAFRKENERMSRKRKECERLFRESYSESYELLTK